MTASLEHAVRLKAFSWLDEQCSRHGSEVLPLDLLRQGFEFDGVRVPLAGPQGIFKPRILEFPLSILTVPGGGPYADAFTDQGLLYAYRGTNPDHVDNRGLREAMRTRTPLVYLHGILPGKYHTAWPVYVVGDDPATLFFTVAVDDARIASRRLADAGEPVATFDPATDQARRAYITSTYRRRLHQQAFREQVLQAYREQCALCRLRHQELLDAAHIIPDSEEAGAPLVTNGLSLCKLHHAAYDGHFLTVRPDFRIEVRPAVLHEEDGPMLLHGLKELQGQLIQLPKTRDQWPDRERLEERMLRFRRAG